MPRQPTPKERREIAAKFAILSDDLGVTEASIQLGEEYGRHANTIRSIAKREAEKQRPITAFANREPRMEVLTSGDFEITEPAHTAAKSTVITVDGERVLEMLASDIHFPYEDAAGYELFVTVADALQPDILVLLGDIMDCYAVSAHDKDANRGTPAAFKDELLYTRTKLAQIRERLPNTRIIYKEGNHETRLSRYITKNAAALSNLGCVTLPELLRLSELKIEWIGNDERLRIGRLYHIHGNEIAGGGMSPARLKYTRMQCSFIFGHHHQRDKYRPRAYDGQQHGAYANPCLCQLKAEYLHHAHNWSLGFSLIDHDADRSFQVDEIEVIKPNDDTRSAKCNVRGQIYNVEV